MGVLWVVDYRIMHGHGLLDAEVSEMVHSLGKAQAIQLGPEHPDPIILGWSASSGGLRLN